MLHPHGRMFATLLGTRITDIRTKLTIRFGELGVHLHHRDGGLACGRTFAIQPDTIPQRMHIVLF
jgi:hypothetical protein